MTSPPARRRPSARGGRSTGSCSARCGTSKAGRRPAPPMARMLQALKNLEARSQRPGGLLSHLAERQELAAEESLQQASALLDALKSDAQPPETEKPRPVRREAPTVGLHSQTVVIEPPALADPAPADAAP